MTVSIYWIIVIAFGFLVHAIYIGNQMISLKTVKKQLEYDLKTKHSDLEKELKEVTSSYDALLDGAIARGFIKKNPKGGLFWTRKGNGQPIIPEDFKMWRVK